MDNEIVLRGVYKGYEYFIVSIRGMWYCAYVILPTENKYYEVDDYDTIPVEVHGGLTFADKHRLVENKWCIGWDYGHIGDYTPIFGDHRDEMEDGFGIPPHHWTPEEIEGDCKYVIEQLIELENGK